MRRVEVLTHFVWFNYFFQNIHNTLLDLDLKFLALHWVNWVTCVVQLKVERMKSQAHEKLAHKLATARRQAEELRLAAETRRADAAARATRKAEILKTNGKITNFLFLSYLCT